MTSVELKTMWLCPQDLPQETSKWNSPVGAVGGWFPLLSSKWARSVTGSLSKESQGNQAPECPPSLNRSSQDLVDWPKASPGLEGGSLGKGEHLPSGTAWGGRRASRRSMRDVEGWALGRQHGD